MKEEKIWCDYLPQYCFAFCGNNEKIAEQGKHTFRIYFNDGNEKLLFGELIDVCKYLFYFEKKWGDIYYIELSDK